MASVSILIRTKTSGSIQVLHGDNLYRHRVQIERTIRIFKDTFALDARRSFSSAVLKADLVMAGILQLVAVLLAKAIASLKLFKSVRKICA